MPYIKPDNRPALDLEIVPLAKRIRTLGELNYSITKLLVQFIKNEDASYATFNDVMGVLNCVGQEFYRRVVVPFEDKKIKENGDVY